jgi:hypothetical protein
MILSRYWNFHQSNQTCDLAGAGVNQAAGRQLAIAGLDSRLTDGGKIVSQRYAPANVYPTRKIPGTHFC